jgi:hypothetical protein
MVFCNPNAPPHFLLVVTCVRMPCRRKCPSAESTLIPGMILVSLWFRPNELSVSAFNRFDSVRRFQLGWLSASLRIH